jgi:SNF2 family DNA or RNA helicase
MKEHVEKSIAPKEETIVEVELTVTQKKYYKAIYEKVPNAPCVWVVCVCGVTSPAGARSDLKTSFTFFLEHGLPHKGLFGR